MKLFKYEDYNLTINEEAFMIKPFRMIWNRDRSKCKEKALLELGFIYFFCDPRSDYMFIVDEEDRKNSIIEQEGMDKKWKIDKVIEEGIETYKYLTQTTSSLLLEDTRLAVDKLRTLLREIDLTALDDKGKPVYQLNMITSTIKQIPGLIKDLMETEKVLNKDLSDTTRMRGQGMKKIFEDGIILNKNEKLN